MASDNSMVASYGMTLRLMRGALTLVPQPLLSATSAYVGFIGGAADLVAHPFRRVTANAHVSRGTGLHREANGSYPRLHRSERSLVSSVLANLALCSVGVKEAHPRKSARCLRNVLATDVIALRHYAEHATCAQLAEGHERRQRRMSTPSGDGYALHSAAVAAAGHQRPHGVAT